ncbi:MAG: hypothetical protein A2509_07735 [Candidatus Edwardsbacteria bacterium RIFOXYD12_FULL_50_11]|uniref:HTH HARE-type domain-containing protein n=1 Tax=Candidatus Edwardsbacteria bacterium GWF2_54_11 TaxID=1817851 RepID=A0A1F5RFP7_9BACT|nr:MAG: hypothetical protein A2502_12380 [Candidatus Edwardsbacteria bacterium RifOxyC12_full_54_24]OGF06561.1 MAG: hypothetical protein A2273_11775 [Candidatus Edwardsbacteria bacterium RifOxyA12_full_54_48]OGF11736.1 MAG: hypothetical protein A3K15_05320 [Candidatus Edwardsbacteria bacterium GWE2_54_12]OGF13280.1 MAG: hypothetical protein A2024_04625 [Candidatus Edwardsbacteria bacterium GWF2_54_11]OGF17879.1 MAG: hypothetical protein A2509_07735 [Candidatus Edwardsbacteria bacterium RIFOXYD1
MEIVRKAPAALNLLWKEGFFKKDKSIAEVETVLHEKGYNFGSATRKALERTKFLMQKGERGNRRFIQKHPYVEIKNEKHK